MRPFNNHDVANVFETYPLDIRHKLLTLRELIFRTAATTIGVGAIEETLKWDEPAYVTSETKSGTTIRIAWKASKPNEYAMYFNCQTTLIETFKTLFPSEFRYEGNRAIVFNVSDVVSNDTLAFCIRAALTYHLNRETKRTGKRHVSA
jgi:Domain of unknown function (DU1801)